MDIRYRHEWKHFINYADLLSIRARLRAVAVPDPHAENGIYRIRSLYFDNLGDKALREKIDGVNMREKFRIRYYNGDTSFIHLEKKSRRHGLGTKYSAELTAAEAQKIVDGDT
ncbi:MAG: VTC domain-containing protein, partial [Lachnospiraceae bacterium]|nr:VTC domain-containing protein [Lachnospiraceae bacterium]